jgi:hypothetical protein
MIRRIKTARLLPLFTIIQLAVGCNPPPAASGLATVRMQIGGKSFTLEVADTEARRERGLMQRDSMESDHGMIFLFTDERPLSFWMKNTRFPLDILYLDAGGKIVSIKQMKPYDLKGVPSDGPAKYAIELNEGMAAKAGVKAGDQLAVPKEIGTAKE